MKLDGRPVEANEMWCKVVATDATLEQVNRDYVDWQKKQYQVSDLFYWKPSKVGRK